MRYIKWFEGFVDNTALPKNFEIDCKPFIDALRKCSDHTFFYRGIDRATEFYKNPVAPLPYSEIQFHCYKINHNWNRHPVDTPTDIHNDFNKVFKENFGWYVRSGIFSTRNAGVAGSYGERFIVVPIGKLEYCWSPKYEDFYGYLEDEIFYKYGAYEDYLKHASILWRSEYGTEHKGQWIYKPKNIETNLQYMDDAIEFIKLKFPGEPEPNSFQWKPAVSFDDYKMSEDKWRKKKDQGVKEIVNTYKSTDLCDTKDCEVSFKADSYYIFGIDDDEDEAAEPDYSKILRNLIWD
jgi:hypothetical protein